MGPVELSLVGIEGQRLPNMSPPSLLLAGHAIILSALAIVAAPAIGRWAQRPRVWWWTAIGNSGAMTLYLWHMPALLGVHLLFDSFGHPRYPGQPNFLGISIEQLFIMVGIVAVLFVALRPLENDPLPGWDGVPAITSVWRGTGVGALLCVAGAATLAAVQWGLKDDGLVCVAVMVTALVGARVLAQKSEAGRPRQRLNGSFRSRRPSRPRGKAARGWRNSAAPRRRPVRARLCGCAV